MISKRIGGLCTALALSIGLSACVDDYGYGGLGVGYGAVGYGGGDYYGDPYADGYGSGYGYGPSYFGWYGDYFYPGTGIYVYDQYRRPYRWNGSQQRYWSSRQRYRGNDWNGRAAWDGFNRRDGDRNFQGNDGRQWQGRRDDDDRRTVQRGYTPGQRGFRDNAPGQPNGGPGIQGYRGIRGVQGVRGAPGAQRTPGYRRDPGAQGYRGQGDRGTPGARGDGGARVGGERPAAVAQPQRDGGRSAGGRADRTSPIARDDNTRPQ